MLNNNVGYLSESWFFFISLVTSFRMLHAVFGSWKRPEFRRHPPRDFPLKAVLVSTDIACKHLSAPKAQSLRAEVTKCIIRQKEQPVSSAKANSKLYKSSSWHWHHYSASWQGKVHGYPKHQGLWEQDVNPAQWHQHVWSAIEGTHAEIQKRTDRNDRTVAKGGPNHYSSQTFYLSYIRINP